MLARISFVVACLAGPLTAAWQTPPAPGPRPAAPAPATATRIGASGELKQWHKVTLSLEGPFARETDTQPNPFLDYRFVVLFAHESGTPVYSVPGYFAAGRGVLLRLQGA